MPKASEPVPDVAFYGTGAIQSRGFTLDGEMHGAWEFFRKDGSVMSSTAAARFGSGGPSTGRAGW